MAVTNLNISQTNGSVLAVFNPLIFLVEATWTGSAPSYISFEVKGDGDVIFNGRAYPISDNGNVRTLKAVVQDVLQSFLVNKSNSFLDFSQSNNSLATVNTSATFRVTFTDGILSDYHEFTGVSASRNIGQSPDFQNYGYDEYPALVAYKDEAFYIPMYNLSVAGDKLTIGVTTYQGVTENTVYRAKHTISSVGTFDIEYTTFDDLPIYTNSVEVKDPCTDGVFVKWLDNYGQYRFWQFGKYYEISDTAKEIGQLEYGITTINGTIGESLSIGKNTERKYFLSTNIETLTERNHIESLYYSPTVYMKIGGVYVVCEIEVSKMLIRPRKGDAFALDIVVKLPNRYTVTR